MGVQLREALRRLCVEIGWSYAVFWRAIRSRDQMHLVWEDGHCERASAAQSISGFEAMDLLLKERAALRNSRDNLFVEPGHETEDRVGSLVYKMMARQLHVVGDGIVGQAALTGDHQWIIRDSLIDYGSVPKPKGLAEMNHQFSAGIQTVVIVPVLPHGVVQLGSTQMVVENTGFIDCIRNLFIQLGCVPGALLADVTQKYLSQNIHEITTSLDRYGDSGTNTSRFSSLSGDGCNHHHLKILGTRSVIPPSCVSNRQVYGKMSYNASEVPLIIQTEAPMMMPLSDFSQPTIHPVVEPISGPVETQVTFSHLDARPIENATPHDSSSRSVQLRSHECRFSNIPTDSNIVPQFGLSKSPNNVSTLERRSLLPGDPPGSCMSSCLVSPSMEVRKLLDPTEHSDNIRMLSGNSQPRCLTSIPKSETVQTEGQQREENILFHNLDIASTKFGEQRSCSGSTLGTQDGWLTNSKVNSRIKSAVCAAAPTWQNIMENHKSESLQASNERASLSPVRPTSGNDLFDLLGLNYNYGAFHGCMDDVNADTHKLSADASTCITQLDMRPDYDELNDEICYSGLFSEASPDQLLDAVVAQINSGAQRNLDDNVSCKTSLTRVCSSPIRPRSPAFGWVAMSEQMPDECLGLSSALVKSEVAGSSSVISGCSMDKTGGCTQKDGGSISQISLWVNNDQNINSDNISAAHGKRIDEVGKLNRKRPRPGESPRPRPKDRQMIQDRVKELREIVPNGAKCSIDALLEKTIKHMLFLQSVTKHADKLKEVGEPKLMSKDGGLLLKDNFEGGATWAFEVGTQSLMCPIIVEDLNPPRQMLVEMLCEERGLFLEIADLIRGLGLTILKGVMEARSDKVWARFAVEANRDVTRMEIFLSLVRLLEPNARSAIVPQGVENLSMSHNMFHPSSIPATGLSDRLR